MIIAFQDRIKVLEFRVSQLEKEKAQLEKEKADIIEAYSKDSSTGFLTKRSLKPALQDLLEKKIPFCFAVIDLDNFKLVNDEHGHAAGDEMLKRVAKIIKNSVRGSDKVIRFGGDEMMLIMPNTSLTNANSVLERIRYTVEKCNDYGMTCSIGLVGNHEDDTVDGVIRRADSFMYAAKNGGKNQVAGE